MIASSTTPLVLIADDEPTMLELVARHLKSMNNPRHDVIEASDGEQAWRLAREHLPDLVVLDVMMPGMSGWEVCRKIREEVALAHTGVVMLTGIGENLNQMTSPLYGADAYVDKPFEFSELDEKVKGALEARAAQREGISRPSVNGVSGPAKSASRKRVAKAVKPTPRLAKAVPRKTKPSAPPTSKTKKRVPPKPASKAAGKARPKPKKAKPVVAKTQKVAAKKRATGGAAKKAKKKKR
jgi:CheY-like chemotaxis protein